MSAHWFSDTHSAWIGDTWTPALADSVRYRAIPDSGGGGGCVQRHCVNECLPVKKVASNIEIWNISLYVQDLTSLTVLIHHIKACRDTQTVWLVRVNKSAKAA